MIVSPIRSPIYPDGTGGSGGEVGDQLLASLGSGWNDSLKWVDSETWTD